MKDKTQTITYVAAGIFLCSYFMRFLNFPNTLTVVLGAILCMIMAVQQKCIRIDFGIVLLTFTMETYYVITNGTRGILFSILYIPLVLYVLGNYMAGGVKNSQNKNDKLLLLIMLLVTGYTIHGILNSYMWFAGYVVPGTRRWQDFWSGEIVPGTQHASYFLPALALFLPAILYFKEKKLINGLIILASTFFCYASLVTKSRGSLLIFVFVFCVQAVLYLFLEKEKVREAISSKKIWVLGIVGAIFIIAAIFVIKDSEVVAAFLANMGKGGGIFHNVRFKSQRLVLEQILTYPMGGRLMDLGGISHAHNVWLDMANAAGVISFLAFTAYTIYTVYEVVKLLRNDAVSPKVKMVIAGIYGAFFLYFTIETALEASVHLTTPWFFVNGLVHGMTSGKEKSKETCERRKINAE